MTWPRASNENFRTTKGKNVLYKKYDVLWKLENQKLE